MKDWGLDTIYKFFRASRDKFVREASVNEFQQYRKLFLTKSGTIFHFEFSEGDLKKIQGLLNELRHLISNLSIWAKTIDIVYLRGLKSYNLSCTRKYQTWTDFGDFSSMPVLSSAKLVKMPNR